MAAYRKTVWRVLIDDYFQDKVGEDQDVLDLGSGWGEFINQIRARKRYAMDLNPEGRNRVEEGVTFLEQDCSLPWELPEESLDVVFTSNFFEHLPSKRALLDTLQQAWRCLKPGGRILCLGPNARYVGGAYWDFFDHHLELTHLSLEEGLHMADFEMESNLPRFLPYTMVGGRKPSLTLVRGYLKLPFAWRFFGKQFLVIARKPRSS